MRFNLIAALSLLGMSLFTGIIIVSIGLGAAFPAMERVAAPFVCGERSLDLQLDHYFYKPNTSGYTITWSCVDSRGESQDVTWKITLVAGLIYSAVIFFISLAGLAFLGRGARGLLEGGAAAGPRPAPAFRIQAGASGGLRKKLQELKELRDSDLITEQEYETKKAELLEEL